MPVEKYFAEERGQRGSGSYKVLSNLHQAWFWSHVPAIRHSQKKHLKINFNLPIGFPERRLWANLSIPRHPIQSLWLHLPCCHWDSQVQILKEKEEALCVAFFDQQILKRWTNAKMEVDTKSLLHPIVQVFLPNNWHFHYKICTGYKEGQAALCCQLFPPPWLHLELWCHPSGKSLKLVCLGTKWPCWYLRLGRTLATQILQRGARWELDLFTSNNFLAVLKTKSLDRETTTLLTYARLARE